MMDGLAHIPLKLYRGRAVPSSSKHVVILGLGPSLEAYVDVVKRIANRRWFADEVWGINGVGDVIQCDRVFHMDDVRVQQVRADALPESNIAAMLEWLRVHPGPVYTSRPHPAYPGLVAFPLTEVMNACGGVAYFNSTAAYAVAAAVSQVLIPVDKITLFGCDFTYPLAHDAEKGRACVEFYLGMAKARGITIGLSDRTSLMDGIATQAARLYGYDTLDVAFEHDADERVTARFVERPGLPTAAEIEAAYDHSKHPSPLVRQET